MSKNEEGKDPGNQTEDLRQEGRPDDQSGGDENLAAGGKSSGEESSWSGPFTELQDMVEDLVDVVRQFGAPGYARHPRLELVEMVDEYRVLMDLPGLARDDVEVNTRGDEITVAGERRRSEYPDGSKVRRSELRYGQFRRSLHMPADADIDTVSAHLADGVLRLTVSRRKGGGGRSVAVESP